MTRDATSLQELLGSIASSRDDVRSLAVVDVRIAEGETTPIHAHEQDEAYHVLEGELVVHLADRSATLHAGDAFRAPAREPHAVVAGKDGAHYLAASFTRSVSRYVDFQQAVAAPAASDSFDGADVVRALGQGAGITVLGFTGALPGQA